MKLGQSDCEKILGWAGESYDYAQNIVYEKFYTIFKDFKNSKKNYWKNIVENILKFLNK